MTKKSLRKLFDDGRYDEIYEGLMNGSIEDKWDIVSQSNGDYDAMFEYVIPELILGYKAVTVTIEPKTKKTAKVESFDRKSLSDYFRMHRDGRCGAYRGHVYLETRKRNGKDYFVLYREIEGSDDPCVDSNWVVVYKGYDIDVVCKHLFVYSDYESYNWNVPYTSGAFGMLDDVVAEYALA